MGLDLYAGPLCRYLSGDWDTCAANVARDTGLKYVLYRASGAPDLLSREDALNLATSYQHQLTEELDDRTSRAVEWKEGFSAPYWTKGLSHSGRMALILWAAYLRYPQLERPRVLPKTYDDDPAYEKVYAERKVHAVVVLDSHVYVPSDEPFFGFATSPFGGSIAVASTAALRQALDLTNAKSWRAPQERIDVWERNGLPSAKEFVDGDLVDVEPAEDPFEQSAQFAFAVNSKAQAFADEHRVPIVVDE